MATKEFLRKMRQKYHLGEYSKKSINKTYASVSKPSKPKRTKRKRTGVVRMAKRRRSSKGSASYSGGGKLMNGLYKPKGLIANALIGAAAGELSDAVAPQMLPMQNLVVAGIVGGLPGVAGSYALNMLQAKSGTKATNTNWGGY